MQKHIDDMLNGEHIVLVMMDRRDMTRLLWDVRLPSQVVVNVTQLKISDPVSDGWIQVALPSTSPEKLRGIIADVRYMPGTSYMVPTEFLEIALERSSRYAAQRKCKPSNK